MTREEDQGSWQGSIGKLSDQELNDFLEEPHLARLACADHDGWPYVVAVWHQWDGKGIWVVPREKSAWAGFLERDPRCAVIVDESSSAEDATVSAVQRRFVAQCQASIVEHPNIGGKWVDIARAMSIRYYGKNGPTYLEPTLDRKRWLIYLEPIKTWTWQGIGWPKRYIEGDVAIK